MKKLLVLAMLLFVIMIGSTAMASDDVTYTVRSGDTLWNISREVGIPVEIILDQNNISNPNNIFAGQRLVITIRYGNTNPTDNNSRGYINYTVKSGDTLWKIAKKNNSTIEEIIENNNLQSPYYVYIGQVLRIPTGNNGSDNNDNDNNQGNQNNRNYVYYTVKPGDILWNIAQKYNTTVQRLVKLNDIKNAYDLYVGRRLLVPNTTPPNNNGNNGNNDNNQRNNNSTYVPYTFYRVEGGDRIWTIADKFGTRVSALIRYNQLEDVNNISVGDVLIIPLEESSKLSYIKNASRKLNNHYRVRSNETLADIADYFMVPEEGIRAINSMTSEEGVYTGQNLLMPVSPALFKQHQLYRVKNGGEYIFDIAYNNGISIRSILQANYLRNQNIRFKAGTVIIVPQDQDSEATWVDYENGEPVNSWFN